MDANFYYKNFPGTEQTKPGYLIRRPFPDGGCEIAFQGAGNGDDNKIFTLDGDNPLRLRNALDEFLGYKRGWQKISTPPTAEGYYLCKGNAHTSYYSVLFFDGVRFISNENCWITHWMNIET